MIRELYSHTDIDTRLDAMARAITAAHHKTPLFIALLRGAAPFASKLMFAIARHQPDYHPELDYMMVKTYGSEKTAGQPEIITDLAPSTTVASRSIIILDDVLDTGVTAAFVRDHMRARGARNVQIAVLVNKINVRADGFEPDFYAFTAGPEWLIGMGLDDPHVAPEAHRWDSTIRQYSSN